MNNKDASRQICNCHRVEICHCESTHGERHTQQIRVTFHAPVGNIQPLNPRYIQVNTKTKRTTRTAHDRKISRHIIQHEDVLSHKHCTGTAVLQKTVKLQNVYDTKRTRHNGLYNVETATTAN